MELSKEQILWLKKANDLEIQDGRATYNENPVLVDLVDKHLITFDSHYDGDLTFTPTGFRLTAEGKSQLAIHQENDKKWFTENWIAPLCTGILGGIIATLSTTALLGWLHIPK